MAIANLPQQDTDPQLRNILLLDKSTAPLASQVQEACSILGITLPQTDHGPDQCSTNFTRSGPREEWTLRWLLKKLEGSTPGLHSSFLGLDIWLLFKELVTRVPVANLARLLRDHGFFDIVLKALRSIQESYDALNPRTTRAAGSSTTSRSGEPSSAADSSSATIVAPAKRKRSTAKKARLVDANLVLKGPSPKSELELARLFKTLSATVWRLQQLAEDESHGYAVEHLKMALRGSPEQASDMFGISLTITEHVLQTAEDAVTDSEIFDLLINPWATVWSCRSRKTTQSTVDLVFAANCLVPALRVLTPNYSLVPTVQLDKVVGLLEDLLMQHILSPVRDMFEISKKARAASDNESQVAEIGSLLAPLSDLIAHRVIQNKPQTGSPELIHPVACLYGIAMENTPLGTSKERISNRPWLQYLFDRLSDHFNSSSAAPPQMEKSAQDQALAIRQMLDIILVHKSNLRTSTLESVLSKLSLIFDAEPDKVNWEIVSLCIKIDPDVFVIPDGKVTSTRAPNALLLALFTKLSLLADSLHEAKDNIFSMVLRDVLVPLVEGFAHARDLIGFISYWKSNLAQQEDSVIEAEVQQLTNGSNGSNKVLDADVTDTRNIWRHEGLSQAVAGPLESHLTTGQIESLLQEANTTIKIAKKTSGPNSWSIFSANLVILDCVLSGCTNENTISTLLTTVQSTYVALLGLLNADGLPLALKWRVWRCIATIKHRWEDEFKQYTELRALEKAAVEGGLKIQTQKGQNNLPKEWLHSFSFLLSVIDSERSNNKALAESIVQPVVSLLDTYAELVISHLPTTSIRHCGFYKIAPKDMEELVAFQTYTLPYASMLCHSKSALCSVSQELQRKFIELVFECDLLDTRRVSRHIDPPFGHRSPWKPLLDWGTFEENRPPADTYRTFQLDKLANSGHWRSPWSVSDGSIYTSAFDRIHQMPCRTFDRNQQSSVVNRVSKNLSENAQMLKDHVKLLIKFLAYPNKDFNILRFPSGNEDLQDESQNDRKPFLFVIAELLYSNCVRCYVDTEAIELLRLLTQQLLNYQVSRDVDAQAASYLTSYYHSLIAYAEKVTAIMQSDQDKDDEKGSYTRRSFESEDSEDAEDLMDSEDGQEPVELNIYSVVVLSASLDFYRRRTVDLPTNVRESLEALSPIVEVRRPVLEALCQWISSGRGYFTKPISEVCDGAHAQSIAQSCQAAAAQYVVAVYQDSFLDRPLHVSFNECIEDLVKKTSERIQITRLSPVDVTQLKEALRLLRKAQRLLAPRYEYGPLETYHRFTDTGNSIPQQKQLVRIVVDSIEDSGSETSAEVMAQLANPGNNSLDRDSMMLLQSLVIRHTRSNFKSAEATTNALSNVINSLSDALLQSQPFQSSVISLHCINIILHKQASPPIKNPI
ncbi:MAG: hypothetical protein Q9168_005640 [Polycauliona sp. 1 TL-2023]